MSPSPVRTRAMTDADADAVLVIYRIGIDEGNATFETQVPTWKRFVAGHLPGYGHVAVDDQDEVLGWVAAGPTSTRACYAGVIEHSVYVHPDARGQHIGKLLLDRLIEVSGAAGVWTIQSSIFPENHASVALHAAAGFRTVGTRERIAQHRGRWRDTLLIERRAPTPAPREVETSQDPPSAHRLAAATDPVSRPKLLG